MPLAILFASQFLLHKFHATFQKHFFLSVSTPFYSVYSALLTSNNERSNAKLIWLKSVNNFYKSFETRPPSSVHFADSFLVDIFIVITFQKYKKAEFGGFLFKIANCHKDLAKAVSKSRGIYL